MREQYKQFDEEFLKNDFLKRHEECLPFIGEKYEESRLLLVGESHYVPKQDVQKVNRDDFYDISFKDLTEGTYKGWIDTRKVFEYRAYDKKEFDPFFSNTATEIAKAIHETNNLSRNQKIDAMHQYAFMNYFKRPAYDQGKTIRELTELDYKYAYDISSYVMEILDPKLIVFLSKKAYWAFCDADNKRLCSKYSIKCVSHPSCVWWNRKRSDGKCAREEFYEYVADLFKQ